MVEQAQVSPLFQQPVQFLRAQHLQERVKSEGRMRQDVEERIAGVEQRLFLLSLALALQHMSCRLEAELARQGTETAQNVETLRERVNSITGGADSDKVRAVLSCCVALPMLAF